MGAFGRSFTQAFVPAYRDAARAYASRQAKKADLKAREALLAQKTRAASMDPAVASFVGLDPAANVSAGERQDYRQAASIMPTLDKLKQNWGSQSPFMLTGSATGQPIMFDPSKYKSLKEATLGLLSTPVAKTIKTFDSREALDQAYGGSWETFAEENSDFGAVQGPGGKWHVTQKHMPFAAMATPSGVESLAMQEWSLNYMGANTEQAQQTNRPVSGGPLDRWIENTMESLMEGRAGSSTPDEPGQARLSAGQDASVGGKGKPPTSAFQSAETTNQALAQKLEKFPQWSRNTTGMAANEKISRQKIVALVYTVREIRKKLTEGSMDAESAALELKGQFPNLLGSYFKEGTPKGQLSARVEMLTQKQSPFFEKGYDDEYKEGVEIAGREYPAARSDQFNNRINLPPFRAF